MKPLSLVLAATLALLQIPATAQSSRPACAPASHYKIIPLPLHPARINNAGVVIGTTAPTDEDHQPALWTQKDGPRVLDLPKGFATAEPLAVNGAGDIVGTAERAANLPLAFKYSSGKFSLLSEERSKAMAIDDAGDTAGQIAERLTLWSKHKAAPLGGCCGGIVHGMNNHGEVVGQVNDKEGHYSAFLWDPAHGLRSIAPPHAANSFAVAVNDAGHVLVKSFTPNAVFLREGGKFTPVEVSAEYASQPLALNNCDVVIGEFGAASDFNRAFIWDRKHGFRDLNKLAAAGTDWILETALDINDRGEIIGKGDRGANQDVGFLLVPETESKTTKATK